MSHSTIHDIVGKIDSRASEHDVLLRYSQLVSAARGIIRDTRNEKDAEYCRMVWSPMNIVNLGYKELMSTEQKRGVIQMRAKWY
jgi:hypothetical protein